MTAAAKILIVGPTWIGDMVMAQSLLKVLKARQPQPRIDVLASAWTLPLLSLMPEVDGTLDMPLGHGKLGLVARHRLGRSLAGKGYDQAILLPNSFKSALIPFFAGIPQRTGWRGEMRYGLINDIRLLDKARYPLMVQRYLALGYEAGAELPADFPYPQLRIPTEARQHILTSLGLPGDKPLLVLCPGAEYGPAKRWPEAYFAEVAGHKIREGWQVWLLGSAKDRPVADAIRQQLGPALQADCHNLAGTTRLDEAIALMAGAEAVVTNDSGLMHVAAALGRPLVVLYGSTSPAFTPPLATRVRNLSLNLDCSPCFKRDCPKLHHACLRDLPPERVLAALQALLGETATPRTLISGRG